MTLWAIVPVKPLRRGKSRLAEVLTQEERKDLNRNLLAHTVDTLAAIPEIEHVLVISRDPEALALAREHGARVAIVHRLGSLAPVKRAMRVVLNDLGMRVEACSSAEPAADWVERRKFDVAVVDVDGAPGAAAVMNEIRQSSSNRNTVTFGLLMSVDVSVMLFDTTESVTVGAIAAGAVVLKLILVSLPAPTKWKVLARDSARRAAQDAGHGQPAAVPGG